MTIQLPLIPKRQGWAPFLLKRTFRSVQSFLFFWKERSLPAVRFCSFVKNVAFRPFFSMFLKRTFRPAVLFRSFEKNVSFWPFFSVLLKSTECSFFSRSAKKNGPFFLRNGKERNVQNGKEQVPIPDVLACCQILNHFFLLDNFARS